MKGSSSIGYCLKAYRTGVYSITESLHGWHDIGWATTSTSTPPHPEPRAAECLDPRSSRKMPAIRHGAGTNPVLLSQNPSTEDGQFHVVVLRVAAARWAWAFTGELCSWARFGLVEIQVLAGTAGVGGTTPPTSTRISARTGEHRSPGRGCARGSPARHAPPTAPRWRAARPRAIVCRCPAAGGGGVHQADARRSAFS